MYSSTCFGRPHAHRQELNNCSSSVWFYRWNVVVAVLLVVVGPVDVYVRLNMCSGVLTPIIRNLTAAVAASGFTVGAW
jgi:hypothetical protein